MPLAGKSANNSIRQSTVRLKIVRALILFFLNTKVNSFNSNLHCFELEKGIKGESKYMAKRNAFI